VSESAGKAPGPRATARAAPAGADEGRGRLWAEWGWIGLGIAGVLAFFYWLAPILTPFALAAVLAYLLGPATNWLQRHGVPRAVACAIMVLLCLAVLLGMVLILVPMVEREILALNQQLPALVAQYNDRWAPVLEQWLGISLRLDSAGLRALALQQVAQQDAFSALLARFGNGGLALLEAAATALLVPVALFYLLLDGHQFASLLDQAIPRRWQAQTLQLLRDVDAVLAQFLRGQLTVMLLLAIYYSAALSVAGMESALPIGILTGTLIFIPYVGIALGLFLASVVALLQFGLWHALIVLALVYGFGQVLEGFFLTPRLVGQRIGLHPLAVIFALLAFGHVFGFFGVLVALPASAISLVALRHVRQRYLASEFYRQP